MSGVGLRGDQAVVSGGINDQKSHFTSVGTDNDSDAGEYHLLFTLLRLLPQV
jgi:hypothetical protein